MDEKQETPIPMILICPRCFIQHVDREEWATKPYRTHLCEHCGHKWRPANVPTVGVASLPPLPKRSPWPLEVARHEDHSIQIVEVDDGDRTLLAMVAVQDDGSGHIGPLPMENGHKARLLVALCEDAGIDLALCAEKTTSDVPTPEGNQTANAIRTVLDAAEGDST
jgi:hypothetical protein